MPYGNEPDEYHKSDSNNTKKAQEAAERAKYGTPRYVPGIPPRQLAIDTAAVTTSVWRVEPAVTAGDFVIYCGGIILLVIESEPFAQEFPIDEAADRAAAAANALAFANYLVYIHNSNVHANDQAGGINAMAREILK